MGERANASRQEALSQAPKREAVATPFWTSSNGYVYLQDIPQADLTAITNASKGEDGKTDNSKVGASLLCKALVIQEDDGTYSPMFVYPDDVDTVAHLGVALLTPITSQVNGFFGFTDDAVRQAKNASESMPSNSSGIDSVPNARIVP